MIRSLLILSLLVLCMPASPCTSFFIHHEGSMVFGRNYDWVADAGLVCTNQRGLFKTSFAYREGKTISWTSKYGSITFNQYGKEFPTGGMNEQGLVVELMWLDGTEYPPASDPRPCIGVLQWIQYQLDNCSGILEVIATDTALRIISSGTPLHYLVADAQGRAATIEFLNGKMVVHTGNTLPLPVLTNDTYASSRDAANRELITGNNSLDRFITACNLIKEYKLAPGKQSIIDYSFKILDRVAQGDFTKWSIVYDISNKQIHYRTLQNASARILSFATQNFACSSPPKAIDINAAGTGNVDGAMQKMEPGLNRRIVNKALIQSAMRIQVSEEDKSRSQSYSFAISCK